MTIYNIQYPLQVRVTWSDWAFYNQPYAIIGNYNISDIFFQNPGVAAAIVTTNNNRYWAS